MRLKTYLLGTVARLNIPKPHPQKPLISPAEKEVAARIASRMGWRGPIIDSIPPLPSPPEAS